VAEQEAQPLNGEARRTIARLASDTVPRLIERLMNSELGELEVREDGWRIRLRRPNGNGLGGPPSMATSAAAAEARVERTVTARAQQPPRPAPPQGVVTSPGVGYFTPRDGFAAGRTVSRGDVIGHVDVLGVRQEVVAPVNGVIGSIDVQAGQAIEYGEQVARIDTTPTAAAASTAATAATAPVEA